MYISLDLFSITLEVFLVDEMYFYMYKYMLRTISAVTRVSLFNMTIFYKVLSCLANLQTIKNFYYCE